MLQRYTFDQDWVCVRVEEEEKKVFWMETSMRNTRMPYLSTPLMAGMSLVREWFAYPQGFATWSDKNASTKPCMTNPSFNYWKEHYEVKEPFYGFEFKPRSKMLEYTWDKHIDRAGCLQPQFKPYCLPCNAVRRLQRHGFTKDAWFEATCLLFLNAFYRFCKFICLDLTITSFFKLGVYTSELPKADMQKLLWFHRSMLRETTKIMSNSHCDY